MNCFVGNKSLSINTEGSTKKLEFQQLMKQLLRTEVTNGAFP